MKQAEHPPVTAGANSAAEYSLALIDQLARIDRTCSKEEMDELVYRLLSLIGEAMQSDRVFLFERLEGTAEAYCNDSIHTCQCICHDHFILTGEHDLIQCHCNDRCDNNVKQ